MLKYEPKFRFYYVLLTFILIYSFSNYFIPFYSLILLCPLPHLASYCCVISLLNCISFHPTLNTIIYSISFYYFVYCINCSFCLFYLFMIRDRETFIHVHVIIMETRFCLRYVRTAMSNETADKHCMFIVRELVSWSGKECQRVDERTGSGYRKASL